jgi:histidyl-tRNA synthetase
VKKLGDYCEAMEISQRIKIDTTLARGLEYYTGMIFEANIVGGEEAKMGLGSIAAGGRYDSLIGMFSKNPIPSAGGSLGIERIFAFFFNAKQPPNHPHHGELFSPPTAWIRWLSQITTCSTRPRVWPRAMLLGSV